MKRTWLVAAVAAASLAVSVCMPTAASAAEAAGKRQYELKLGPKPCPGHPREVCSIANIETGPDFKWQDWVGLRVRLLGKHGPVKLGGNIWDYTTGQVVQSIPRTLPQGTYTLTVSMSLSGEWNCSVYDPNVCSWSSPMYLDMRYTLRWPKASQQRDYQVRLIPDVVNLRYG